MANNNLIESPIDGPGGGAPGGVADAALGIPSDRIYNDAAARDAALSTPLQGWTCAIRNGSGGQIWQIYDATLPGWLPTGTGGGVTPDTWRDATGTTSNPAFTDIARHDADLLVNGVTVGLGGGQITTNLAFGTNALSSNITGGQNVAIGNNALLSSDATNNLAIGDRSLQQTTTGTPNVAVGTLAMRLNETGRFNAAFGANALEFNITGFKNSAFGSATLRNNTGSNNTAYGIASLLNLSSGNSNTSVGAESADNLSSGSNNIFIGRRCGDLITSGNNNTLIGTNLNTLGASVSSTVILADGTGSPALYRISTGEVGLSGVTDPTESIDTSGTARLRNVPSNDSGGNSIKRIFLESDTGVVTGQYNVEGQVKLNNAGGVKPSLTNFTANQPKYFLYNGGALNFSGSPTTQWPSNILAPVDADFIKPTTFALLENPIQGQVHIWRILYSYENKGSSQNIGIVVGLVNGDNSASTFVTSQNQSAPSGTVSTPTFDFSVAQPGITNPNRIVYEQVTLITIADNASIGTGYRLFAGTTITDNDLRITIQSVTRTTLQKVIR